MSEHDDLSADLARLRALSGVKWTRYPADVLPCWVADMDLPTAPPVTDALRDLIERGDFGYNFATHAALPECFADWTDAHHRWRPAPVQVRVFCDVLQAVDLALWLGTEPGDGVVLFTPVYPPFFRCIERIGRRIVDCPLHPAGWRLERDALDEAIERAAAEGIRTRAVLLCSPHNPTGRVFGPHELAAVAEVARERDLLVISDEIWADMVFSDGYFRHVPIAAGFPFVADRTVTVAAASKAFNLAGLRCAVAHIGDERLRAKMAGLPDHLLGAVSTPGAVATLAAWTEGGEWLAETVAFLESQRNHLAARLAAELPDVRWAPPQATYLAWLDFRACELGDDPAAWLLE
ncbi:MAG: aminotransferase class I/II-fold pyridoxal phosphate-dependent enzyme, partial [Coriobacteriia bacterium]|nr:aminotransferase class I/II-fold pyridoxal phosphate-dependent enzyme [Coriobacteriia bacterium]